MKFKNSFFIVIVIFHIFILTNCSKKIEESNRGGNITGSKVYIGVAWSDSKSDLFIEGIKLALEEINKNNGVLGKKLDYIFKTETGDEQNALDIAKSFSENPNLIAVIGHGSSTGAIAASVTYFLDKVLFFTPRATAPSLTKNGLDNIFRLVSSDIYVGKCAAFLSQNLNAKKVAVANTIDDYGRELSTVYMTEASNLDISVVNKISILSGLANYHEDIAKLKTIEFDLLFLATGLTDGSNFIKQFRDMGFKQPVVGGGALYRNKLFQITGKEAENIYAMSLYNPDKNTNAYLTFKNNFKKKFNKEPDDMALIAYDGIYTLVNAIKKTDSFRTANISPILHYNYHYDGISNKFQFNEDGDLTNHNLFFYKAVNKKFERIDIDFNSLLLKKKAAIISSD